MCTRVCAFAPAQVHCAHVSFMLATFLFSEVLLAWDLLSRPGLLASGPRDICLYLPSTGIISMCHHAQLFEWVLCSELECPGLQGKHFAKWATSSAQEAVLLKWTHIWNKVSYSVPAIPALGKWKQEDQCVRSPPTPQKKQQLRNSMAKRYTRQTQESPLMK